MIKMRNLYRAIGSLFIAAASLILLAICIPYLLLEDNDWVYVDSCTYSGYNFECVQGGECVIIPTVNTTDCTYMPSIHSEKYEKLFGISILMLFEARWPVGREVTCWKKGCQYFSVKDSFRLPPGNVSTKTFGIVVVGFLSISSIFWFFYAFYIFSLIRRGQEESSNLSRTPPIIGFDSTDSRSAQPPGTRLSYMTPPHLSARLDPISF